MIFAFHSRIELCWLEGSSEGLVLASAVVEVLWLWVVKVVGLVAVVAVADDRMLDAFALQLVLLVNSLQFRHQLSDEGLRRSTAPRVGIQLKCSSRHYTVVKSFFYVTRVYFQCELNFFFFLNVDLFIKYVDFSFNF